MVLILTSKGIQETTLDKVQIHPSMVTTMENGIQVWKFPNPSHTYVNQIATTLLGETVIGNVIIDGLSLDDLRQKVVNYGKLTSKMNGEFVPLPEELKMAKQWEDAQRDMELQMKYDEKRKKLLIEDFIDE